MDNERVANNLKRTAKMLTGAVDLADIIEERNEIQETRDELRRKKQEIMDELNRQQVALEKNIRQMQKDLLEEIKNELVSFFEGEGYEIKRTDNDGSLLEVILQEDDTVPPESQVSAHVNFEVDKPRRTYKLRSGDDNIDGQLSESNTVSELLDIVETAEDRGFWTEQGG